MLLAACGSSHKPSSSSKGTSGSGSASLCPSGEAACISRSPKAKVVGPSSLVVNLTASIARTSPMLKSVKLSCPQHAPFPILCRMTALEATGGKVLRVAGTCRVLGVATSTHTYAFALDYAPVRS